jgi:autotransporter-associated beta strand protein
MPSRKRKRDPRKLAATAAVVTVGAVGLVIFAILSGTLASAATIVWANVGTTFSTAANWIGGAAPADNITSDVASFQGAVTNNPILTDSRSIAGLNFASGTGAWNFSANTAGGDNTLTLGASGIVNNSTSTQTFSNADLRLQLGANSTFNGASGALNFDSSVDRVELGGFDLTLDGAVGGTIGTRIIGTGNLIKTGAGTWTLSGPNTYSGTTTIGTANGPNAGALVLGANNVLPDTAVIIYGGILDVNTRTDTIGSLTMGGGAAGSTAQVLIGTGGVLTLGGTVTYDAANNPNGALISGPGTLALGGNRTFNIGDSSAAASDLTISAIISGANTITKTGAGELTFSGANTYTGVTTVSNGVLNIQNNAALGTTAGGTVVASGAALELQNSITVTGETLSLAGTGIGSTGALRNISGTNTWTGAVTLTNATEMQSDAGLMTVSGSVTAANFGLTVDGSGNSALSGVLGLGTGGLTKTGAGTLTLSGANTYTGATTIGAAGGASGGTIVLGANNTLPGSAVNLFAGTLDVNTRTDAIGALNLGGGAGGTTALVTIGNAGLLTLGGDVTYDASNNPNGASITGTGTGTLALGANRTFNVGDSSAATNDLTISAIISGAFGITKTGNGVLALSGANTYSGTNNINVGTVRVSANTNLGTGTVSLNGGTLNTTATMTLGPTSRVLTFGAAGGTLDVNTGTTLTYDGIIAGTGKLTKTGTGTFQTGGGAQNSHSGDVDILAGTFQITKAGFFGGIDNAAEVFVATGATLSMNGNAAYTQETIGPLYGGGTVINEGAAAVNFRIDTPAGTNANFSGTITDTANNLNLFKLGDGTQILSGNNSYDGPTVISNGVLQIGAGGTTGTLGTGNVTNQAGLVFNRAGTYTAANNIAGTGGLTNVGAGTVTLSGSNTWTGPTRVSGGTLVLSNTSGGQAAGGTSSIQVDNGATLALGADNQIGNSTSLILNGGTFRVGTASAGYSDTLGTLTLSASSTIDLGAFTGVHTIQFANSSAVSWTTNATLTISNWQGIARNTGDAGRLLFGPGGLTSAQLAQVRWAPQNINGGVLINANGELTPIPEPRIYAAALALLAAVGWRERKRLASLFLRR